MNPTTVLALLQIVSSLLTGIQHSGSLPVATTEQTITIASQAIQLSSQAIAKVDFPVPQNNGIWPNIPDLLHSAYLDTNGNYVPLGSTITLIQGDTSFGDINGDGTDDAAVIVQRTDSDGGISFALAAMLNQGGVMFNIADVPLGSTLQVFSHNVVPGTGIVLNMQQGNSPAATSTYTLLGDQLIKE